MLRVFEKRYPNVKISQSEGVEVNILMDFNAATDKRQG